MVAGRIAKRATHWLDRLQQHQIRILNVAGPREMRQPGTYADARALLLWLWSAQDI